MQWLIDLIYEKMLAAGFATQAWVQAQGYATEAWVKLYLEGLIVLWSGEEDNVPDGWHLCNGEAGTINLTGRFVIHPSDGIQTHDTGGFTSHNHNFTGDGHRHRATGGAAIQSGTGYGEFDGYKEAVGTTDPESNMPPYYALAFIQKI